MGERLGADRILLAARAALEAALRRQVAGHIGAGDEVESRVRVRGRDESTAVASQYYAKLPPNLPSSYVVIVDPMLATGGSAVAGLDVLKKAGAQNIRIVCIVAAPEGIALVEKSHPDVEIYTPVIDRGLNAQKFILPGLGDFGDRLYGTL